jgi:hypothetical protein
MPAPAARMRLASISVVLLVFSTGVARNASAGPIELENDVSVSWADLPITVKPSLCAPGIDCIPIFGAPRLVPDARNAGNLLDIAVDFLGVSLQSPNPGDPFMATPFVLSVFDVDANPIFRPGGSVPLQLTHFIAPSGGLSIPATDFVLNLGAFDDFGLLPQGDVIFTVGFKPTFAITDRSPTRPDQAAIITLSGAGTVVPEPSTLVLLLTGLAGTGLGARRLRVGHRTSNN